MTDEVEITLPISKKVVVIRNYTTRGDDAKAEAAMYAGVDSEVSEDSAGKPQLVFPVGNIMNSRTAYIYSMVRTVDGRTDTKLQLDELRSEDYKVVADTVEAIVEKHSPKVKEAKNASENS